MEEKIEKLINSCLTNCNLPFTYKKVKLLKSNYYDDDNYSIELSFEGYNGKKETHKNVINCYDGNLTQIMFQDYGFPGASINFDRELIPEGAIIGLRKVAYFEDKFKKLKTEKKANI